MAIKNKSIIFILFLLVLAEAFFIFRLSSQKTAETKEKLDLKLQLKNVSADLATKESQAKELETKLVDLEKVKNDFKAQIDELTTVQKIADAKLEAAKQTAETLAQQFQRQHEDTFQQLKNFTSDNRKIQLALIAKIESLIETKYDLEKQLAKLQEEQANQGAGQENTGASQEIPLGKINVQPKQKAPEPTPSPRGSVLSVDNNYNFAIIDLGKESGIKVKDRLMVLRRDKKVGEVEIKEVYRNMSIADIVTDKTTSALRKNDKVILSASQ